MGAVVSPGDVLVAGEESVGRQLRLRNATGEYVSGRLTAFSGESGMHRFATAQTEEWVQLSQKAYRWMSPVSTHARPNPTFRNFPGNHEAIGWKVKVYWNEMGKWYVGRVRAYDQLTGLHKVVFADGDVRWYTIRDEAVVWVEKLTGGKKSNGSWMPEGSESRKPVSTKKLSTSTTTTTSTSSFESSLSGHAGTFVPSIARGARNGMTLRPRKNPSLEQLIEKNPNYCIVRTRIGIYWPSDGKYYQGTIQEYNEDGEKYRLLYEDNQEEDVDLEKDAFKWFGPKGITAGYSSLMKEVMLSLGAENLHADPTPSPPDMTPEMLSPLSQPKEVVGRHVWLYWEATGEKYEAEVLAYDSRRKMHYLWFRDGELEWVDLKRERFVWGTERYLKEFPSGLEAGESVPRGKAAVGWRIAVYWRDDVQFYSGRVSKYDADTGRHDVDYDDGQMETLSLSTEKIIWKASPSLPASDSSVGSTQQKTQKKATSSSLKRRRLPSPSSEVAKENNAALIEGVSALDSPIDIDYAGRTESVKRLSLDTDDDLELFPVVSIPPEPLPPLQHTRVAKLPPSFGASAFQVKVVARQPEDRSCSDRSTDGRSQWIEIYQSISSKVGRFPSYLEASATSFQLPIDVPSLDYPTEAMTGQDNVTSKMTHPVLQRQSSRSNRRKKTRPLSRKSSSLGSHPSSLETVLASFPSVTQISPKDRQNLPPVIPESIKNDVDYSRNLFDAARCGKLPPFLDLPSPDALCCVKDGMESMKRGGNDM